MKRLLFIVGLWVAAILPASAAFYTQESAFMLQMEDGYYTHVGEVLPGHTYSGPGDTGWFSYSVTANGVTVNVVDFASIGEYKVSGTGGYFAGASSLTYRLSDGTSFSPEETSDGFMGFTTDNPATVWITSMRFSGTDQPTLRNFTVGVDCFVPESETWVAAALLAVPLLVNGVRVLRKQRLG